MIRLIRGRGGDFSSTAVVEDEETSLGCSCCDDDDGQASASARSVATPSCLFINEDDVRNATGPDVVVTVVSSNLVAALVAVEYSVFIAN